MIPISEAPASAFASIKYVLTDIDDTLTRDGILEESAYRAIWTLCSAGVKVIPVTGRPAGWCDCIARQWPVAGVVGENGAFAFYREGETLRYLYHPETASSPEEARRRLRSLAGSVLEQVPGSRIAKDQFSRKFDVAIDFREEEPKLGYEAAYQIRDILVAGGAHAKVSSIHVNAWFGTYDKLSMSQLFLQEVFGVDLIADTEQIVFCGDSPNDEPMFQAVSNSVAVANIEPFVERLGHKPRYVTSLSHGEGFEQVSQLIVRGREFSSSDKL